MAKKFNKLLFPIDSSLVSLYRNTDNADLFTTEGTQDFLIVPFKEFGGYSPIWEKNGNQFTEGALSTFVRVSPRRYGFQVNTNDSRFVIYQVLSELVGAAQSNPAVYNPIVCRDYHNPIHAPANLPYSERAGIINDLLPGGGTLSFNDRTLVSTGTKFKFLEKILRTA